MQNYFSHFVTKMPSRTMPHTFNDEVQKQLSTLQKNYPDYELEKTVEEDDFAYCWKHKVQLVMALETTYFVQVNMNNTYKIIQDSQKPLKEELIRSIKVPR